MQQRKRFRTDNEATIVLDGPHDQKAGPAYTRIYRDKKARKCAVARLKRLGLNYFVLYKDVQGFGMQAGIAKWVPHGQVYIQ